MVLENVQLYVLPRFSKKADIRLLDPYQTAAQAERKVLFKKLPNDFSLTAYTLTEDKNAADFFIVPQSVKVLTPEIEKYLDEQCVLAREYNKKIIVYLTGDLCHKVQIRRPEVIVITGSIYTSSCYENEVVFAPFTEDLGEQRKTEARAKGARPLVSFCGYAGFPTLKTRLKYYLVNFLFDILGSQVYKRGIFYRRRALAALSKDSRIDTSFIIRDSFSANANTAKDPEKLREEYLSNIIESDYVLCPKGDANFSSRFYETLSLGRIPVLIDTQMRLPLEKTIDYSQFIIRVPYTEVDRVGDYVSKFHDSLTDEQFQAMQRIAKDMYHRYLRFDAYYNEMLPRLKRGGIPAVL